MVTTDFVVVSGEVTSKAVFDKKAQEELVESIDALKKKCKDLLGKVLVTHQTGPQGKEVKRLYIEEASDIKKEFYLSCLVDRSSSKIAFIS